MPQQPTPRGRLGLFFAPSPADDPRAMRKDRHAEFVAPLVKGANIPARERDVQARDRTPVRVEDPLRDLVERAKRGDRDAFGQLYRHHHVGIFRMARFHLGRDAEDVVAEVFLRAWTALPRYRDTGAPFAAWLYGIARHVVLDEFARRARTEPRDQLPDRGSEWREDDRLAIAAAIERLPTEQRQVIELKFVLGLRNPEVAAALGVSIGAVNAKQWRALGALREMLESDR